LDKISRERRLWWLLVGTVVAGALALEVLLRLLYLVHFDPGQPPGQQYVGNGHMTSYGYWVVADLVAQRLKTASLGGPLSH